MQQKVQILTHSVIMQQQVQIMTHLMTQKVVQQKVQRVTQTQQKVQRVTLKYTIMKVVMLPETQTVSK